MPVSTGVCASSRRFLHDCDCFRSQFLHATALSTVLSNCEILKSSHVGHPPLCIFDFLHRLSRQLARNGDGTSQRDPNLPSAQVAFQRAGQHYREALKIDSTNWHAGNGIAVLLAQHNFTVSGLLLQPCGNLQCQVLGLVPLMSL